MWEHIRKNGFTIAVLLFAILVLFTPIGFKLRVKLSTLLASGVAMAKATMQVPVDTYDWRLTRLDGTGFDFNTQHDQVVLINFWATWCPPCVAEMPGLQKLYDDYDDRVTFLFVAKDNRDRVTRFLAKNGYSLPVYFSDGKDPVVLASKTLPSTYVVDRQGKIRVAETGVADWNASETRELLDTLLAE